MAFSQQPIRPFTEQDILSLTPGQMGCYGIFREGVWVYIGSGDIRERMLSHVRGDNPCITNQNPTSWVGEVTLNYIAREKQLILECNPVCNKRVG